MTCPKYDAEKGFFGDLKHLCITEGFFSSNKIEVDDSHARKFCLTRESFWNGPPKYKDCPHYNK
jgi:hypothetical protein